MSGRSYEPDDGPLTAQQIEQVKNSVENKPIAWTRTGVDSPIIHEEMMQRHPELRQYYLVPLYMAPGDKE
jgi:hypothetical protein